LLHIFDENFRDMKKPATPFPVTGYYGPEFFCDREEETTTLTNNFRSGISTTLVSIRRLGKTGLIHHVNHKLSKEYLTVYIDIQSTENINDFLNVFATAIIRTIPDKPIGKNIWNYIKSLRPVFTFDNLTGSPQVTFDSKPEASERSIEAVLSLLEVFPKRVLIAIDEFQQILNYPEKNTDAWLRSIYQHLKNVSFIFSGSRQHIMTELFNSPSRPFYRSTSFLKLDKISAEKYAAFILKKFKSAQREISSETVHEILEWTECYTYYVQLLCSKIFIAGQKEINTVSWQTEAHKLLSEQEAVFYNYRELLTKTQWILLKALAVEDIVYSPTNKDFISKYGLGSSASVLRSLDALIEKEMVYFDYDNKGNKYYKVYDLLLKRWMQHLL
jgi:uncharacterized protein